MKTIVTRSNHAIYVSDEDFNEMNKHKWHIRKWNEKSYACGKQWIPDKKRTSFVSSRKPGVKRLVNGYYKSLRMHRVIMNCPNEREVDHIDGNGLNNVRENLRIVNHQENMQNVRLRRTSKTGTIGVSFDRQTGKWRATITIKGRFKSLGRFKDITEAIRVRKKAELTYFSVI